MGFNTLIFCLYALAADYTSEKRYRAFGFYGLIGVLMGLQALNCWWRAIKDLWFQKIMKTAFFTICWQLFLCSNGVQIVLWNIKYGRVGKAALKKSNLFI